MINVVAWSKNRACQLDLTLSTYKKYFSEWKSCQVSIIYTYSDESYKRGYDLCQKLHPEFNWIKETNFRQDTLKAIFTSPHTYQSFMVDDDVFVDRFSLEDKECQELFKNQSVACISPRLAPYINYCYTANHTQPQPTFLKDRDHLWEWRGKPYDWGYPWSVASFHIFRKSDIVNLQMLKFKGANSFEGGFISAASFNGRELMSCYKQAKCICSTNNKVQIENGNRHENSDPLDILNSNFINGKRLDSDINDKYTLNMCHGPLKYEWRK
jgi:hypothetical protein